MQKNAEKQSSNTGKITLYPNELDFIFSKFTSFSAFKCYLFLLKTTNFGKFPENLKNFTLQKIGGVLGTSRQQVNRDIATLVKMGLVLKKNSEITHIFRIIQLQNFDNESTAQLDLEHDFEELKSNVDNSHENVDSCHQSDYTCHQSDDNLSSNCLQDVINLMTKAQQIDDKKCPKERLRLVKTVSLYLFTSISLASHRGEVPYFCSLLDSIMKKDFREKAKCEALMLMRIFGVSEIEKLIREQMENGTHALSVIEKVIEIKITSISKKMNKGIQSQEILSVISKGFLKVSEIPDELLNNLNDLDLEFMRHYGLVQISQQSNQINNLINNFMEVRQ